MAIHLLPLGINGFFSSFCRQTMSFLVLAKDRVILLDAGTGVCRLIEKDIKEILQPYNCLDIILSHYHYDHIVGLSYLLGVWDKKVRIFGPGKPFVQVDTEKALYKFFSQPFFPANLQTLPMRVEIIPVTKSDIRIGDLSVRLWPQNHPGGSAGIKIENSIAYITDTVVKKANQEFIRGTKLLLHEVWLTDKEAEDDPAERSRHSYVSTVAQFAKEAGVKSLMPIHHQPKRTNKDIQKLVQDLEKLSGVPTLIPREKKLYKID